ncbi:MAG: class I SAM-dependent methyltransferase [Marinifilaceae bacterium]
MQQMWNERYQKNPNAYGTKPNEFFKDFLETCEKWRLLLPGDGEGRNAVYAALQGYRVDSFDYSEKAVEHARELARKHNVDINCFQADLMSYEGKTGYYDTVAAIYVHLPSEMRKVAHKHFVEALKPGGHLLMEVFAKEQLEYKTGGPGDEDMLYDLDEFEQEFKDLEILFLEKMEIELDEGEFHRGRACAIRFIGRKKE